MRPLPIKVKARFAAFLLGSGLDAPGVQRASAAHRILRTTLRVAQLDQPEKAAVR